MLYVVNLNKKFVDIFIKSLIAKVTCLGLIHNPFLPVSCKTSLPTTTEHLDVIFILNFLFQISNIIPNGEELKRI